MAIINLNGEFIALMAGMRGLLDGMPIRPEHCVLATQEERDAAAELVRCGAADALLWPIEKKRPRGTGMPAAATEQNG